MLGSIGRFLKDRKGAFAMQFALLAVPLTVCTGLAIDGGRAFLARYELASALDAAALAVGSTYSEDADINAMAHKFVNSNFHGEHIGEIELVLESDEERVLLRGYATIPTYFMPLVGQDEVRVSAESEVKRGGTNIEVSLALDVTQSMDGSRINSLKDAAEDLVNQVVDDIQTPYFSKVAIAPWANNVHVGDLADELRGSLRGPTGITGAHWRDGSQKTILSAGWRYGDAGNNAGTVNIDGATWRSGSAKTITGITKATQAVVTAASHGYANGDYVYIYGVGGMTQVNLERYQVSDKNTNTFKIKDADTGAYVSSSSFSTWVAGSPNNGRVQKCFTQTCEVLVTVSGNATNASNHGYQDGQYVHITGVGGITQINNATSPRSTWAIKSRSDTTFILTGASGTPASPAAAWPAYTASGSDKAERCYDAECHVGVTATAHGFATDDRVYIRDVDTLTQINNATGSTWQVGATTADTFIVSGQSWTTVSAYNTGKASECYDTACHIKVTSAAHKLVSGDHVQISSVGGITGANKNGTDAWTVYSAPTTDVYYVDTWGPGVSNATTNYTSSTGTTQCVSAGCTKYRFQTAQSTPTWVVRSASNCVTERTGANAYTDVSPTVAKLGPHYPGADSLVSCEDNNQVTPLTPDKDLLIERIGQMDVTGSTAGQIGAAWGWYMVSPSWADVWTADISKPKDYDEKELTKFVVLMTDGEFNTAHCEGVQSESYGYESIPNSDRNNCDPDETPFEQAAHFCTNMKAEGVDIVVYTVGFELESGSEGEEFLADCATGPSYAFLAASGDELAAAFDSIATSISRLRLAK